MPRETITLHRGELCLTQTARMLAAVAYPLDAKGRERAEKAIVHVALRNADAALSDELITLPGRYVIGAAAPESEFKRVERRLSDRRLAGAMALPYLPATAIPQRKVALSPDGLKLSVNHLAEQMAAILDGSGGGDISNVKTRIWGRSRPVLHLCAALAFVTGQRAKEHWNGNPWQILEDVEALEQVISCATWARPLIVAAAHLKIREDEQIAVELV